MGEPNPAALELIIIQNKFEEFQCVQLQFFSWPMQLILYVGTMPSSLLRRVSIALISIISVSP